MKENPRKCWIWGLWGPISTVNFKEKVAQKFHTIILLHLGLITFRFHFGKARKPWFSWFSDFGTCPWLLTLWETGTFENIGKTGAGEPENPSNLFENLEYEINKIKKHQTVFLNLWNFESLKLGDWVETLEIWNLKWNFATSKPRHFGSFEL